MTREDVGRNDVAGTVRLEQTAFQSVAARNGNVVDRAFTALFSRLTRRIGVSEKRPWFDGQAAQGYAVTKSITRAGYDALVSYAMCDYLDEAERAHEGCASKANARDNAAAVQNFVAETVGRNEATELQTKQGSSLRAGESEPLVVFFGLAGLNRVLLLDCRTAGPPVNRGGPPTCTRYAEPWHTSLQQADYVWVVYLEDDSTPFDTSIDVDYRQRRAGVDYDEFDAEAEVGRRNLTTAGSGDLSTQNRVLRVGAKRLRIRDAPVSMVASFTRRGPNYGVRQWQKGFTKTSDHWWGVAGTVSFGTKSSRSQALKLIPEPSGEFGAPRYSRVTVAETDNWGYVGVALRWPGRRARVMDYRGAFTRFIMNLVPPDLAVGMAPRKGNGPYIASLSWPLYSDRLHAFFGMDFAERVEFQQGFVAAQLVPIGASPDAVGRSRIRRNGVMYGITYDFVRSK